VIGVSVVDAVERDLSTIRRLSPDLADSGLAASALVLAAELDSPGNSATSKSMCARALIEALERLRELAPAGDEEDKLDELGARRAARIGGAAS